MRKKKLQVFISSTYKDLIEERQAAVEAILSCGHIPAGMELFAAGDESQMKVIQRWIEESDAFLLILGGRYGTIEAKSGKSYIHLEYEYAASLNKPIFAVVVEEESLEIKIKEKGSLVLEKDNPKEFKSFKQLVLTKMVKFFDDIRDIKLAIHETMAEFGRRNDLIGWVRGDQEIDTDSLAEELARLANENSKLRERLLETDTKNENNFQGLSFDEVVKLLKNTDYQNELSENLKRSDKLRKCKESFNDENVNLFHFFWVFKDVLASGIPSDIYKQNMKNINQLKSYGLVDRIGSIYGFTVEGRKFYLKLQVQYSDII